MKCFLVAVLCLLLIDPYAQLPKRNLRQPGIQVNNYPEAASLIQRCEQYKTIHPDSLQLLARRLHQLGKQHHQLIIQSWGSMYEALSKNLAGQAAAAFAMAQTAIPIVKAQNNEQVLLTKWYTVAGMSLMKLNRQREALDTFYRCLRVAEQAGDHEMRYRMYNNIGWAFMELNHYEKAIDNFRESLQIIRHNNLPDRYASIYNNMASCYGALGQHDSTLKFVQRGIAIAQQHHDYAAEANGFNIMGTLLSARQQYQQALQYFLQAQPIREKIGDPFYIVSDLAEIARLQAKLGDTAAGLRYCREALHIAEKNKLAAKLPMIYDAMVQNYEAGGNFAAAALMYKKINALKDQLYKDANPQALAEIETKYETEKKEKQIQLQQFAIVRNNYWFAGIALALLSGALLTWSFYHRYKLKQEALLQQEILHQQQVASKAVLEAEEKERKRIAEDLHDGIGQMMSAAKMNLSAIENELVFKTPDQKLKFERIIGLIDESCREVRNVSHHMMPHVLVNAGLGAALKEFTDKVDNTVLEIELYHEGLQERLDMNVEAILYRVIQECVNNVIKHAAASHLTISLIKDADGLSATIEDNGIGFDAGKKNGHEGMGLKNIRTRIEYLKGSVDFDTRPGNGTLVAIHIPLQNRD
jgi:two-component system NarL family sensor kinase